jgi:ABC-type transport system involved in Fe-S cluster assembly fused permease/ATPase subunit
LYPNNLFLSGGDHAVVNPLLFSFYFRFYQALSGQVLLNNNDVQELNRSWLRANISYAGQHPIPFAGTLHQNILLGKKDATNYNEEVTNAAKATNDIGAVGSLLSSGQKQRVAIARKVHAILKRLISPKRCPIVATIKARDIHVWNARTFHVPPSRFQIA